jgi:hypothetical protein
MKGIITEEHTIVYSASSSKEKPPRPLKGEVLHKGPIRMMPEPGAKLSDTSRFEFGKSYVVEHHAKVVSLGKIAKEDRPKLQFYYDEVRATRYRASNSDTRTVGHIIKAKTQVTVMNWASD